jgi:excisionase family DNA binding protein
MSMETPDIMNENLLTPGEVARLLRVDPKTVNRWAKDGRLHRVRTPGGQSRFRESEIRELLAGGQE